MCNFFAPCLPARTGIDIQSPLLTTEWYCSLMPLREILAGRAIFQSNRTHRKESAEKMHEHGIFGRAY